MSKYRVSEDEIKKHETATEEKGFGSMDIRFLLTDLTVGATELSLYRTVFPQGFSAHHKHIHIDTEEIVYGVRGRGVIGIQDPDGIVTDVEISRGVAVFIPKNYVHWYRVLEPDEKGEVEICGAYSNPKIAENKAEHYKYIGEITEQDKILTKEDIRKGIGSVEKRVSGK